MNVEDDESTPLLHGNSSARRNENAGISLTILISLLTAAVMVLILAIIMGQSHHASVTTPPAAAHVIEMAAFQLKTGVKRVDFVDHAHALQPFFSTHHAVQRSLVFQTTNYENGMLYHACDDTSNNNTTTTFWVDIVYWESMDEALEAAKDIVKDETAQPFLQSINTSTLTLQHFTIDMDWMPQQSRSSSSSSLYVEVALFELVNDITDEKFLVDANATTPFFEQTPAAQRRILSHGHENEDTWLDLVYWTSVKEAKEAAKAIEEFAPARPFLNDMNATSPSFQFDYYQVGLWQDFTQEQQIKKRRQSGS